METLTIEHECLWTLMDIVEYWEQQNPQFRIYSVRTDPIDGQYVAVITYTQRRR